VEHAHRARDSFWLLFLDLDSFKEINDSLGHHVGDRLLVKIGKRIKQSLRKSDTVARLGGDEFVILLNGEIDDAGVDNVAFNLIRMLVRPIHLENLKVVTTASIGIAHYPSDGKNADDLLRFADQAMYAAKRGGKNRFAHFQPSLQAESERRVQVNAELLQALQSNQLELYYQPVVDLKCNKTVKAEALIRWNHPTRGLLHPGDFIPYAEESRSIQAVGNWVVEEAIRQVRQWQPRLGDDFHLSVNISPAQLRCHDEEGDRSIKALEQSDLKNMPIAV
jgi:diguanylate cyclase (GGDEF)-like protein